MRMYAFSMLQGTQRLVDGRLIGVIASEAGEDGSGRARLAVRQGEVVDRFTIEEGQSALLSDGWSLRLAGVEVFPSGAGKATLDLELVPPDEQADDA